MRTHSVRSLAGGMGASPSPYELVKEAIDLQFAELEILENTIRLMRAIGATSQQSFRAQVVLQATAQQRERIVNINERIDKLQRANVSAAPRQSATSSAPMARGGGRAKTRTLESLAGTMNGSVSARELVNAAIGLQLAELAILERTVSLMRASGVLPGCDVRFAIMSRATDEMRAQLATVAERVEELHRAIA